jgi:recombination protein RecA
MALGILPDRLLISQPEYAEQSLDIAEGLLRSDQLDVLALDSLAFLTPAIEIKESTGAQMMGVQARTIGRGVRKFVMALNWAGNQGRRPTIFFTNQIRMKIGVVFGNPEVQSGGLAAGFSATTEVRCNLGKFEMEPTPKEAPTTFMARPLYVDLQFKSSPPKARSSARRC